MVDFDAAEAKGMGVRVRLSQTDAAAGFDFLLVVGIKDSPNKTTRLLTDLFNAHHYTDGLSSFARAHLPTTPRMRHLDLAQTIRVTKPAISPNSKNPQLRVPGPTANYLPKRSD